MIDTLELYKKFSAERAPDRCDLNASKMYALLEDAFGVWCSFHAPQSEAVEEINRYESFKLKTERTAKDHWILEKYPQTVFVDGRAEQDKFRQTLRFMAEGAQAIAGAALWNLPENIWGGVNLLVKVEGEKSVFGDFYYTILQQKRASEMKEHYIMQSALLNKILGDIQGVYPYFSKVILREKEINVDYYRQIQRTLDTVEFWRKIKDGSLEPEPHKPPKAAAPPWRVYANKTVKERKDLLMLPHLSPDMRGILKNAGIKNTDMAEAAGLAKLRTLLDEPFATECYFNSLAYLKGKPVLKDEAAFPPPVKKRNLYFDFEATETFTRNNDQFVYLIGLWDKEENKFVSFVAKNKEEEEKIFVDFYNYVTDFENTALYHWTEYEVRKMKSLADTYPAAREKLLALCKISFDLKISAAKAFYLPSPSFSLKAAAPAFGFNWRQNDCGAMDSMVFYTNWQRTGRQDFLDKVLMYNEDDCYAMLYLEDKLKEYLASGDIIKAEPPGPLPEKK